MNASVGGMAVLESKKLTPVSDFWVASRFNVDFRMTVITQKHKLNMGVWSTLSKRGVISKPTYVRHESTFFVAYGGHAPTLFALLPGTQRLMAFLWKMRIDSSKLRIEEGNIRFRVNLRTKCTILGKLTKRMLLHSRFCKFCDFVPAVLTIFPLLHFQSVAHHHNHE